MNTFRTGARAILMAALATALVPASGELSAHNIRSAARHTAVWNGHIATAEYHPGSKARGSSTAITEPVTYISDLDSEARWNHFPLRVAFVHDANWTASREAAITAGFDQWITATHDFVRFTIVMSPARADVVVRCDPSLDHGVTDTSYNAEGVTLQHANIAMGLADSDNPGGTLCNADLQALSAHEFGHALGIAGHSQDPHDLMYPVLDENRSITARDLGTLYTVYGVRAS